MSNPKNPKVFIDWTIGGKAAGRTVFELRADVVPITAENFRAMCTGEKGVLPHSRGKKFHLKGNLSHRIVRNFMIQLGDLDHAMGRVTGAAGTGGFGLTGRNFKDENFKLPHKKYCLSMANSGKNTNGSQIFIVTDPSGATFLQGKHCVFAYLVSGAKVIDEIELRARPDRNEKPTVAIAVADCGELKPEPPQQQPKNQQQNQQQQQQTKKEDDPLSRMAASSKALAQNQLQQQKQKQQQQQGQNQQQQQQQASKAAVAQDSAGGGGAGGQAQRLKLERAELLEAHAQRLIARASALRKSAGGLAGKRHSREEQGESASAAAQPPRPSHKDQQMNDGEDEDEGDDDDDDEEM